MAKKQSSSVHPKMSGRKPSSSRQKPKPKMTSRKTPVRILGRSEHEKAQKRAKEAEKKTADELATLIEKGRVEDADNFSNAALKVIVNVGERCRIDFKALKTTYPQYDDSSAKFYSLSIKRSAGEHYLVITDEQALRGSAMNVKAGDKEPPNDGGIRVPLTHDDLVKLYLRMFG